MKLTRSLLKQLIKEEMSLSRKKTALNEGFFEDVIRAEEAWACEIQQEIGREKTKSIATRIFENATNWENIVREELAHHRGRSEEGPEWLIKEIDAKIPGLNSVTMNLLSEYVERLSDKHYNWYLKEIDKFLKC